MINWIPLESSDQLKQIIEHSKTTPVAIFKHSTRCSISSMAKYRLEDNWSFDTKDLPIYYLDLIAHRQISTEIAEVFSVHHESPQILLIDKGACIYADSHMDITVDALKEQVS